MIKVIPFSDLRFTIVLSLFFRIRLFRSSKLFSIRANSGVYRGINAKYIPHDSRWFLTIFARCEEALSKRMRIFFFCISCCITKNFFSSTKYSLNSELMIFPEIVAFNDQLEPVIQEISDKEPEYFIFVMLSSNPFRNHDLLFIKERENRASSMFKITFIFGNSYAILTAKYDFVIKFWSTSRFTGLYFPILYDNPSFDYMYFRTKWIGTLIPDSL